MTQRPNALQDNDRDSLLAELEGWTYNGGERSIKKEFRFKDFSEAWAFMNRAALLAEQMDHHPEWFNVYNRVDVTLTTHDADGVTQLDIDMAKAMESFCQ